MTRIFTTRAAASAGRFALACAMLATALGAPLAAQSSIQPGKWESRGTVKSMKMPGLPPELANSMAGRSHSASQCIKPDDLKDLEKKLFKSSDGSCRYTSFNMGGGKLSATMKCKGEMAMDGTMQGTYTATTYDMNMSMRGDNGMEMNMQTSGRRTGAC